jgi:hypothetical protein
MHAFGAVPGAVWRVAGQQARSRGVIGGAVRATYGRNLHLVNCAGCLSASSFGSTLGLRFSNRLSSSHPVFNPQPNDCVPGSYVTGGFLLPVSMSHSP